MKQLTGFQHGVNLGGWMSQCDYSAERLDRFITEEDFRTIAGWGLDHVRLPFDFNVVETADGSAYLEEGFARIGRAVRLALDNGLNIVLDLHKTAGFSFDVDEKEVGFFEQASCQERFYRLWEEMARRFGGDPERVAFELLNEVTDKEYGPVWNRIAAECIRRIRKIAPRTILLVGGYWNNHATAVRDLDPPADDRVVYNFHCYDPLHFTHQGAGWVYRDDFDRDHRETFEESGVTEAFFEDIMREAVEAAEKNGTVLYCGEYGVIDTVPAEDTLKWYRTIARVFDRHGIGRAAWTYRSMDFELCGDRIAPVIGELTKVM